MPLVGELELARALKRDRRAVRQAVENGRISAPVNNLFDLDQALKEWEETTHHEKGHNNRVAADIPTPDIPLRAEARSSDYAKARSAATTYDALTKKANYEKKIGTLTPTADVEQARFTEFRILRDACFNIPVRIAAILAGESNMERCQQLLEAELYNVFTAFADGKLST